MDREVKKTQFATHYIDSENSLITQVWTNENREMTTEQYKTDMLNFLKLVQIYKPKNALVDSFHLNYLINPEVQRWVDKEIGSKATRYLRNVAFILPDNIFQQVSIEQTMQEQAGQYYANIQYFNNKEEALNWLLNI